MTIKLCQRCKCACAIPDDQIENYAEPFLCPLCRLKDPPTIRAERVTLPPTPTLFEELEARIRRLELLVLMYPVPLDAASGWITGDGGTLDDDGVARIQDLLVELRQEVFGAG